jgi:hypothetical protein
MKYEKKSYAIVIFILFYSIIKKVELPCSNFFLIYIKDSFEYLFFRKTILLSRRVEANGQVGFISGILHVELVYTRLKSKLSTISPVDLCFIHQHLFTY